MSYLYIISLKSKLVHVNSGEKVAQNGEFYFLNVLYVLLFSRSSDGDFISQNMTLRAEVQFLVGHRKC